MQTNIESTRKSLSKKKQIQSCNNWIFQNLRNSSCLQRMSTNPGKRMHSSNSRRKRSNSRSNSGVSSSSSSRISLRAKKAVNIGKWGPFRFALWKRNMKWKFTNNSIHYLSYWMTWKSFHNYLFVVFWRRTGDEVKTINSGLNYDGTEKVGDYFRKQARLSLESESDIEEDGENESLKKPIKLVRETNRLSVSSLSDCEDESYIARIEAQRKRDSLSDFGLSPET